MKAVNIIMKTRNLYLVRHGQSVYNMENRFTGWEDVDLTELGEKKIHFKQSKINQLLTELKDLKFNDIVNINTPGGGYQFYNQLYE